MLRRITNETLRVKSKSESLSEAQCDMFRWKSNWRNREQSTDATCDSDIYDIWTLDCYIRLTSDRLRTDQFSQGKRQGLKQNCIEKIVSIGFSRLQFCQIYDTADDR